MRKAPFLALPFFVAAAHADFTAANIQFLLANDLSSDYPVFAKPDNPMPMFTLEVANGWKYGDNFFFTDLEQGPQYDKDFLGVKDWVKNKPQFVLKWNL